jgi:hypothetical protein
MGGRIQINMKAMHKRGKLEKLKEYLRNPFTPTFTNAVLNKLRANIISSENRPLKYHTYKSAQHTPGTLAGTCFVEKTGATGIILGSYEPYAGILEFGRRAMHRKKPFIFKGYYPNPTAVRMALNNSKAAKLYLPMKEFTRKTGGVGMNRGGGIVTLTDAEGSTTTRRAGGKGGIKGSEFVPMKRGTSKGKNISYDSNLRGEAMRKQNIAFLSGEMASKVVEMKETSRVQVSQVKDYAKGVMNFQGGGAETPMRGTPRFRVKGKKAYKNALPYGVYTVFSTKLEGIKPYHVFTKTAEWAEEKFVNEVKSVVRKIDMNMNMAT